MLATTFFPHVLEEATVADILVGPEIDQTLASALREAPERAGTKSPVQAAGAWIDDVRRWRETFRVRWEFAEASNIVEARMILLAVRHLARAQATRNHRILLFTDNLAALAVFSRGRTSTTPLGPICRGLAAFSMGCGIQLQLRWVPSRRNHADGPSRGTKLGYLQILSDVREKRRYHG